MKYRSEQSPIPRSERKKLNEKILHLIKKDNAAAYSITPEDIYNAYTGDGGLHGLERSDFEDYHAYSEAKKEMENGQFFTPHVLCDFVISCLQPSDSDLVADLTCGMGNFFNFLPTESNAYGCELDPRAFQVARFLYPAASIEQGDIRTYSPELRFDYVVGNPPFHLKWWISDGAEIPSHLYYCLKAAEVLKPMGILAVIVPQSFLADSFTDKGMIKKMERHFSFLGQVELPDTAFSSLGVTHFPTKLQFWQNRSSMEGWNPRPYHTELDYSLQKGFDIQADALKIYRDILVPAKALLEQNSSLIFLELSKKADISRDFLYQVRKLLYHIRVHPATRPQYAKCCEYLNRFYTQKQPADMSYEKWCQTKITEPKVISYLQKAVRRQNQKPERDVIRLVKKGGQLSYKAYSTQARRRMTEPMCTPVPIHQAVLDNEPGSFPGYERLLRRKRAEYDCQSRPFAEMEEGAAIAQWLEGFSLWDHGNMELIRLNPLQKHDINLVIQKRYALLQWEQGSGKTLAGIATGLYRMERQGVHSTWVVSSAISIRNNWNVVLKNYDIPFIFVEKLKDLERVRPGIFVLLTLNKVSSLQRHLQKKVKCLKENIQLVLDESDEISNPNSRRCQAALSCFRRCRMKLLTTGTSTRNNISEFAPQLELLYNNSINMISWNRRLYRHDPDNEDEDAEADAYANPFYGQPIPPYKKGYALFAASHLPEKVTVFGIEKRSQDIYNANDLNRLLGKTVITRTFEEVSGKEIKQLHQIPMRFPPHEREVYETAMKEFHKMRDNYFSSTGNSRKDAMMRLIQQITLLLRISAAPDTVREYQGDTPVKVMTAVELAASWENEIIAIGVRHKTVLDSYKKALQEYLPDRPLFIVTGSDTTFAQRRALRQELKDSGNGILLCTQQSLPSSVNFEYVNKVIIPELHYNHSGMSQFYFRFIRYNSTEYKDVYFLTYTGSIESNLMQMILCKEKLTLFMKGQDVDLDEIYDRFQIDYDLLSCLMVQERDKDGHLNIQWGKQKIA